MTTCSRCNTPILFIRTAASNGTKSIPIDLEPNPDGNVELVRSESRRQTEAVVHAAGQLVLEIGEQPIRYMPHFATCPHADEFRPKKETE